MPDKEDGSSKPSAIEDLDKRLRQAQISSAPPQAAAARGSSIGMALRVSTELVAGLVVGGFIGWALDRWLGTTPWFLLVFFFLGMAAGILNVVHTSQQINADLTNEDASDQIGSEKRD